MLDVLARASIGGGVAVLLVWIVCRASAERLTPAARAALWWCAAAKFLVALVWTSPIAIAVLPPRVNVAATPAPATAAPATAGFRAGDGGGDMTPGAATVADDGGSDDRDDPSLSASVRRAVSSVPSPAIEIGWVLIVAAIALVGARRWRRGRALVTRSWPAPAPIVDLAQGMAARLSLDRVPPVRMSAGIQSPLVIGWRRPVVLLPSETFPALGSRQQAMALCHELAHVKRADVRLGSVPALAGALFFFHPLARLAGREYAIAREAACDAAVLRALDVAPREYGRLLLDLGVVRSHLAPGAAGASASSSALKRRLVMLNEYPSRSTAARALTFAAIGLAVLAIAPVRLVARSAPAPDPAALQTVATPPATVQQTPAALPQAPASRVSIVAAPRVSRQIVRTAPPTPPTVNRVKVAPVQTVVTQKPQPLPPQVRFTRTLQGIGTNFVLFDSDGTVTVNIADGSPRASIRVLHAGTPADPGPLKNAIDHAGEFRKAGERLLWFARNGHEYAIRDTATLAEFDKLVPSSPRFVYAKNAQPASTLHVPPNAVWTRGYPTGADRQALESRIENARQALAQLSERLRADANQADQQQTTTQMRDVGVRLQELARDLQQGAGPAIHWVMSSTTNEVAVNALFDRTITSGIAQQVK